MRIWVVGVALLSSAMALAQDSQRLTLFDTLRPEVTVVVREHSTSADLIEITVLNPDYPPELLQRQAMRIGEETGSASRGVQVVSRSLDEANSRLAFLKATFATDHVIDRAQGVLRLGPIARAFAGAPAPYTISGITVMFDGEAASPQIVRKFANDSVALEGRVTQEPAGIEYRIQLLSQDPATIQIPERVDAEAISKTTRTNGSPRTVLIALCALAALAAGALVYLALMRNPPRGPK